MKKFYNGLFNFFWIFLVGISSAISNTLIGMGYMITIIGIPFGLQYFKFLPLIFAPAGKVVVTKFKTHPVMNTLWLIFGGLELYLIYQLLALLLCMTIIGIPLAIQLRKIANFYLAPFGAEIINENEYSKYGNTTHDMNLLARRIVANPDKIIGVSDNSSLTAKEFLSDVKQNYYAELATANKKINYPIFISSIVFFIIIAIITHEFFSILISFIVLFAIASFLSFTIFPNVAARITYKYFEPLKSHFPNESKQVSEIKFDFSLLSAKYCLPGTYCYKALNL